MTKRLIAILLGLGGLLLALYSLGAGTWWKPQATVTATSEAQSDVPYVITAPGVLELVDEVVEVKATADSGVVEMALADSTEAESWLGDSPALEVTGLTDWETLETTRIDGEGEAAPIGGSVLWIEEVSGEGEVSLDLKIPTGNFAVIATTEDGTAPAISLTWQREVAAPWWMIPGIILGTILMALGIYLFNEDNKRRVKERRRHEREERRAERRARLSGQDTTVLPRVETDEPIDPADRDAVATSTNTAYGASIIPASSRATELREAELADEDRVIIPGSEDSDDDDHSAFAPVDTDETYDDEDEVEIVESYDDEDEVDEGDVEYVESDDMDDAEVIDDADVTEADDSPVEADEPEAKEPSDSDDWRDLWGMRPKENN